MKLPLGFAAALAMVFALGCASQTEEIPGAARPTAALARQSGKPIAELEQGYSVYMLKCGECHERKLPSQISDMSWHRVVPGMAWNAGLSDADEKALLSYLVAARAAQ